MINPHLCDWHILKTKDGYFFTLWNHKGDTSRTITAKTYQELLAKIAELEKGWTP